MWRILEVWRGRIEAGTLVWDLSMRAKERAQKAKKWT
jgi:hypothetical protein